MSDLTLPEHLPRPVPPVPEDCEQREALELENAQEQRHQEELLKALRNFAEDVFKQNVTNVRYTNRNARWSFGILLAMYILIFVVGLVTAGFAIVKGLEVNTGGEALGTFAIAGLSAASFFSLFLVKPLESLERNSIYSAWLTAALNTYWTRLMYFSDLDAIDAELEDATEDLEKHLTVLADKHAAATAKNPTLVSFEPEKANGDAPAAKEKKAETVKRVARSRREAEVQQFSISRNAASILRQQAEEEREKLAEELVAQEED